MPKKVCRHSEGNTMYKLQTTSLYHKELDEIIAYIAEHLKNPSAATRLLDGIVDCYADLKKMPKMYEHCRDERLSKMGYRKAVIQNYILIYRVDDSSKTVHILHIFYGRRDYQNYI